MVWVYFLGFILSIVQLAALYYVAIHFIRKFW